MRAILFITLIIAANVMTQYPQSKYACLQQGNDPTWGPFCTTCYGYDTIPQFPICGNHLGVANCQLTFIPDGDFRSFCQLCEANFSINVKTGQCDPVTPAQTVTNCDLYWTSSKATDPVCLACSEGFVPNMKDPATHTIECITDAAQLQANCKWMQIDREKEKHQTVYVPECLACKIGFVMYNDIKLVSLFAEKITSTCSPAIKNDDGCLEHNTVKNIVGEKIMDTCIGCDPRVGYFAIQPSGKFTPGRSVCAKAKTETE